MMRYSRPPLRKLHMSPTVPIRYLVNLYYLPYKEWNYSITHWSMPEEDKLTMSRFLEMHGGTCA